MRQFASTIVVICGVVVLSAPLTARAGTVALWLFDEPVGSPRNSVLKDATGHGFDLELGDGQIVAGGMFGNGLRCPTQVTDFAARRSDVQGTGLNLGNRDWTIEWWQRREGPVAHGHVDWVYLLADDEVDRDAAKKSWEMGFQTEARFCGAGVWSHDQAGGDTPLGLNVFADKYDEVNRIAFVRDVNLDFYNGVDRGFHHVAWVYDAQIRRLMYFEDGRGPFYVRDGTFDTPGNQVHSVYGLMGMGPLDKYPWKYDVYNDSGKTTLYIGGENVIGPDEKNGIGIAKIPEGYRFTPRPRGEQTAKGVIDEMRVSDEALYRRPFTPPNTFAGKSDRPWMVMSERRLDYRSVAGAAAAQRERVVRLQNTGGGEVAWKATSDSPWASVTPAEGRLKANQDAQVTVTVHPSSLWPSIHKARITFTTDSAQPPQILDVQYTIQPVGSVTWLFDEAAGSPPRFQLEDQSINGYDLLLGHGGQIVTGGRFGNALDPRGPRPGWAAVRRFIDPGLLNLGDFDWTWECWVRAQEPAQQGDVLFMERENVCIGPWPSYRGIGPATGLEFGPPGTLRFINVRSGLKGQALQSDPGLARGDGRWHHLALAYESASRRLFHWVDGIQRDAVTLPAPLTCFDSTGENNLSVGKTIEGERPFKGLIDEMRFSAGVRYRGSFEPPKSLAPPKEPLALHAGPHLLVDDYLIERAENLQRVQHTPEYPVDKPQGWDEYMRVVGAPQIVDDGPACADPKRRFKRVAYFHSLAESPQIGGYVLYYAPTINGPWVSYENNPFLHYVWAGQPGSMVGGSDVLSMLFDPLLKKYLIYHKTYPLSGENPELSWYRDERYNYHNRVLSGMRRLPSVMTSDDGLHWTTPQRIINMDDWDVGEAQAQIHMVYRRGDLLLGHLCMHNDEIDRAVMYTVLTASRDGYHWTRWREPFIPYGQEPTRGDKVIIPEGNDQLFIKGDFMYLGIGVQGSHKPPRRSWSGCARLPIDRFVSRRDVAGGNGGAGRFVTPLVTFEQGVTALQINSKVRDAAEGGEAGYVAVQIRDAADHVIPGFSFADCAPLRGDALHQTVKWKDKSLVDLPANARPVRLEFELRNADLYAFYLVGPGWDGDHDFTPTKDQGRTDLTDPYDLLGIARPKAGERSALTVTPMALTFTLQKGVGLGYSGETPEQTITVKSDDSAVKLRISEAIPWLELGSASHRNADGSMTYSMRAVGGALDRAVYLGKVVIHVDGTAVSPIEIPVTFNLK